MSFLRKFGLPALGILVALAAVLVMLVYTVPSAGPRADHRDPADTAEISAEPTDPNKTGAPLAEWETTPTRPGSVRAGENSRTLTVRVSLPLGSEDCARNVHLDKTTEDEKFISAKLSYETKYPRIKGPCYDYKNLDLTLTANKPIGNRDLVFDDNYPDPWHKWSSGYGHCNSMLGCHPPADHCDQDFIDETIRVGDIRFTDKPTASLDIRVATRLGWSSTGRPVTARISTAPAPMPSAGTASTIAGPATTAGRRSRAESGAAVPTCMPSNRSSPRRCARS
jgi:hypothetical protein